MPYVCVSHVAVYVCCNTHVPYVQMSHVARSAETRIHIHDQTSFHGHCQCSSRRLIRITRCCICPTCTYFNLAIPAVIPASQCLFVVVQLIQNCWRSIWFSLLIWFWFSPFSFFSVKFWWIRTRKGQSWIWLLKRAVFYRREKDLLDSNAPRTCIHRWPLFQGVLLHPDGEVRPAGAERRDQEPGRLEGCSRLRALQGAQPPLQPKQPHWGEDMITLGNQPWPISFLLLLSLLTRAKGSVPPLINHEAMAVTTQVGFITFGQRPLSNNPASPPYCHWQNYITAKNINHSTATPWPIARPHQSHFALENRDGNFAFGKNSAKLARVQISCANFRNHESVKSSRVLEEAVD